MPRTARGPPPKGIRKAKKGLRKAKAGVRKAKAKAGEATDKAADKLPIADLELAQRRRLLRLVLWLVAGSLLLYGIGLGVLVWLHLTTVGWTSFWLQALSSLLGAVLLPIPGATTALLVAVRGHWVLGIMSVLGTAAGGTAGAAILHILGGAGRAMLERKAKKSERSRKILAWSRKLVGKWTYLGVALLLVPPFVPRPIVLYAASTQHLKQVPYLLCVFAGLLARNLILLAIVNIGTHG
ncbi:MAG TPA: VTT domain-containing protein [Candidatus Thermoplasmatota archaeon]|nr:VTT domain-containing protein [Candidatus Thermoplasmatota archaeon]